MMMMKIQVLDDYCIVHPEEPLTAADFDAIAAAIDPIIEADGELDGLIIHTRDFPGWESFGDMLAHLRFVRDHHQRIEKVALVTDAGIATLAQKVAEHFVAAEVRQFGFEQLDAAVKWVD